MKRSEWRLALPAAKIRWRASGIQENVGVSENGREPLKSGRAGPGGQGSSQVVSPLPSKATATAMLLPSGANAMEGLLKCVWDGNGTGKYGFGFASGGVAVVTRKVKPFEDSNESMAS